MMGGIELMCKWYVGVNDLDIFYYFVFEMCFLQFIIYIFFKIFFVKYRLLSYFIN